MTTGPTDVKVTTAAGGPDGMPLALKLNEGLGRTGLARLCLTLLRQPKPLPCGEECSTADPGTA